MVKHMAKINQSANSRFGVLAAIYLSTFICLIDLSSVNLALSVIQEQMNSPMSQLQWIIDSYALCMSGLMLAVGPLSNRIGRKTMWLIGIAIFTIGSAWCALAPNFTQLLLGRVIQGIAGAILIPSALTILMNAFTNPAERGRVIGSWSSFSALALVTGPLIGGLLVHYFGWQSIFWINLPIGMIAFYWGFRFIKQDADRQAVIFDYVGLLLSTLSIVSLTYTLIMVAEPEQRSWVIFSALIFIISLCTFIQQQKCCRYALLPKHLLKNRDFIAYNAASLILGLCGYSILFVFAIFYQDIADFSAAAAGWLIAPLFLAQAIMSTIFGKIQTRFTPHRLLKWGYVMSGLAMMTILTFHAQTPIWVFIVLSALLGGALGLVIPASSLLVMQSVSSADANITSAIMNTLRQTGMTLGIAIFGSVMAMVGDTFNPTTGFHAAILLAGCLLLIFGVFLILRKQPAIS